MKSSLRRLLAWEGICLKCHWKSYAFLMRYAEQNGFHAAGPARECYIDGIWNKESEEEWLTEIQLPVE